MTDVGRKGCGPHRAKKAGPSADTELDHPLSVNAITCDTGTDAKRTARMPDQKRTSGFETREPPPEPTVIAPDGSHVRELLSLPSGSAAHFELAPGAVSRAGRHRTVDEIWYILSGRGEMWRRAAGFEEVVSLELGVCLSIPAGTSFQFRSIGDSPLTAFAVTMPPWSAGSDDEWMEAPAHWPNESAR